MANRAGLKKVTKTVRGKKGAVKRSYWVKAKEAVSGFAKNHGKKILAGAALAGGAALAYKHRHAALTKLAMRHTLAKNQYKGAVSGAITGAAKRLRDSAIKHVAMRKALLRNR